MKIAASTHRDSMAAVFDFSEELTIFEIVDGKIISQQKTEISQSLLPLRIAKIVDLNITCVICGAISNRAAILLEHNSVQIISGIAGKIPEVMDLILKDNFVPSRHCLPGFTQGAHFKRRSWGRVLPKMGKPDCPKWKRFRPD